MHALSWLEWNSCQPSLPLLSGPPKGFGVPGAPGAAPAAAGVKAAPGAAPGAAGAAAPGAKAAPGAAPAAAAGDKGGKGKDKDSKK